MGTLVHNLDEATDDGQSRAEDLEDPVSSSPVHQPQLRRPAIAVAQAKDCLGHKKVILERILNY